MTISPPGRSLSYSTFAYVYNAINTYMYHMEGRILESGLPYHGHPYIAMANYKVEHSTVFKWVSPYFFASPFSKTRMKEP